MGLTLCFRRIHNISNKDRRASPWGFLCFFSDACWILVYKRAFSRWDSWWLSRSSCLDLFTVGCEVNDVTKLHFTSCPPSQMKIVPLDMACVEWMDGLCFNPISITAKSICVRVRAGEMLKNVLPCFMYPLTTTEPQHLQPFPSFTLIPTSSLAAFQFQ